MVDVDMAARRRIERRGLSIVLHLQTKLRIESLGSNRVSLARLRSDKSRCSPPMALRAATRGIDIMTPRRMYRSS